jgi:hypothetical protein
MAGVYFPSGLSVQPKSAQTLPGVLRLCPCSAIVASVVALGACSDDSPPTNDLLPPAVSRAVYKTDIVELNAGACEPNRPYF